ncbi:hypothetical protein AB0K89_15945 [Streptomyces cinnamoneus]|uniref:hypothetical protein n=1 Tax=Streptomyces cinnamoneus TaxID=53446 RepID=UPI00343E8E72
MKVRYVVPVLTALVIAGMTSCSSGHKGSESVSMDEAKARSRAEEIVRQAVEGMAPKPRLEPQANTVRECLKDSGGESDGLVQVQLTYWLKDVPGAAAKGLVKHARDAWVARGYAFQTDGDWSDPFPSVAMRTDSDDFWMTAVTGVLNKESGDGLASIEVTSPCFRPAHSSGRDERASGHKPAPVVESLTSDGHQELDVDEALKRTVLAHSSKVFDALQVPAIAEDADELRLIPGSSATAAKLQHTWQTTPLNGAQANAAVTRLHRYVQEEDWRVCRDVAGENGGRYLVSEHRDGTVLQMYCGVEGPLRVAIAAPMTRDA